MRFFRDPSKVDALAFDPSMYTALAASGDRSLRDELVVPARAGLAWPVLKGQVCRITTIDGPQAGDLNIWSLSNPREHFWAARSRMLEGTHVTTLSRLWSTRPYHRPMLTFIADTLPTEPSPSGGRCHDLIGSGCDPFIWKLMNGVDFDRTCYNNLARAIAPRHLTEFDVHDVVNLFMRTGLDPRTGMYMLEPVPAKTGDYVEFFAEIDLLCALSSCPAGDISAAHLGAGSADTASSCRPLGVQVYDVDPGILDGWTSPRPVETLPVV